MSPFKRDLTGFTAAVLLLTTAVVSGCAHQEARQSEPARRIEEAGFVPIGGIEQWITVRGEDRAKPILLIVHGGPGDSQSTLTEVYAPYERDFIVVQWDQRGSGRTYIRNRDAVTELNLSRMTADGVEVAQYATRRLGKPKLIVLGHSWGSTLALEMVKLRPELFSAYVGTGQVASWRAAADEQWMVLRNRAEAAQDEETLDAMQKIGKPDPLNVGQYFSWRTILNRKYLGESDAAWLQRLRTMDAAALGVSEADMKLMSEGATFSGKALIGTMMSIDLFASTREVPVPFFVIQGKEDLYTPTAPAIRYFDSVTAPVKKISVIDGAGHFAMTTHPELFRRELVAMTSESLR